jgi:hypothetical protein
VQIASSVGATITLTDPHGDVCRQLLQERDKTRAWCLDAARDLGQADSHINVLQDALTISEHKTNLVQMMLAEAEAKIIGKLSQPYFKPRLPLF